ncbi:MAG: class A beta-lactamase-related serine hydrolase [Candidatus Eremiobacteraeota bacterium]|nr:class A beta-lactamase-related serine hydrolase [Candidatus Eremiobacteraeota bacterium]
MHRRVALLLVAFLLSTPVSTSGAQTDLQLEHRLSGYVAHYGGKVALFATDLRSGKSVALAADAPVPTASVIKLTILFEALKEIQAGTARFGEPLQLTAENQVEGSGVLAQFDTPQTITLRDALTLMIVVSDNTATNLLIDRFGLEQIDSRIQWMGLHDTWLYKKVFKPAPAGAPADQKRFGLGKTTAREMAAVMRRFATCDLSSPGTSSAPPAADQQLCAVAIKMLKNQTDGAAIPRYLGALEVGNKTGALDEVRNDVAVVYARNGPIVISAFTYDNKDKSWTPDNRAQLLIAHLAKLIVDRWQ